MLYSIMYVVDNSACIAKKYTKNYITLTKYYEILKTNVKQSHALILCHLRYQ